MVSRRHSDARNWNLLLRATSTAMSISISRSVTAHTSASSRSGDFSPICGVQPHIWSRDRGTSDVMHPPLFVERSNRLRLTYLPRLARTARKLTYGSTPRMFPATRSPPLFTSATIRSARRPVGRLRPSPSRAAFPCSSSRPESTREVAREPATTMPVSSESGLLVTAGSIPTTMRIIPSAGHRLLAAGRVDQVRVHSAPGTSVRISAISSCRPMRVPSYFGRCPGRTPAPGSPGSRRSCAVS